MNNTTSLKTRYEWIDALRAFAIIGVIYGHSSPGLNEIYVFNDPVKIPLFFILSGFLFKQPDGSFKDYLLGVIRKLVIPWILLATIAALPVFIENILTQNYNSILLTIKDIITGIKHWFMPCFIIGSIIHYIIRRYIKNNIFFFIISVSCFFIGIIMKEYSIGDIFMLNRAIHVQFYFYLGYILRDNEFIYKNVNVKIIGICVILYIIGCLFSIFLYPGLRLDTHKCFYYNIGLCLTLIVIGNFCLFSLSQKLSQIPSWVRFVGRNSLVIYMLQVCGFVPVRMVTKLLKLDEILSRPFLALNTYNSCCRNLFHIICYNK